MRPFILLISILLMSGCNTLLPEKSSLSQFPLLTPESLNQSWQKTQIVDIYRDDQTQRAFTAIVVWSVDSDAINVAALTSSGQSVLKVTYDGHQLSEEYSNLLPEHLQSLLSGHTLLAQLQLAHWPENVIHDHLFDGPWHWQPEDQGFALSHKNRRVLKLQPVDRFSPDTSFELDYYAYKLRLVIRTMSSQPLPEAAPHALKNT